MSRRDRNSGQASYSPYRKMITVRTQSARTTPQAYPYGYQRSSEDGIVVHGSFLEYSLNIRL